MIVCPLCNKLVRNETDTACVEDDCLQAFHCPTYIDVHPGVRWCHYQRIVSPTTGLFYITIIPPFYIIWWDDEYQLFDVRVFGYNPNNWRDQRRIHHATGVSNEQRLRRYKKYQKLRAFT